MNTAQLSTWLPSFAVPFFTLSYPVPAPPHPDSFPDSSYYDIGRLDSCIVVTSIVIMALARDMSRLYILEPAARWKITRDAKSAKTKEKKTNGRANGALNGNGHANGHAAHPNGGSEAVYFTPRERKEMHRKVIRFAEQGWNVIYYILQWSYGLYVYCNTPASPTKTDNLWIGYPHFPLAGPVKLYYLTQTAFYMHSVLVLHAEEHRADHVQMMTHHVITIALIVTSYFYNFTRVGCMIMVLMDWCDIWLPLAKMFRYINWRTICDATFTLFLLSWLVTRHVFFALIIYSLYQAPSRQLLPFDWIPAKGYFFTQPVYMVFCSLLVTLQLIQLLWFWRICQVAWRVISGQGAEDNRSEDEMDDDDDDDDDEETRKER